MSNFTKIPRELISLISTNPRVIKFIENLQTQVVDLNPAQIEQLIAEIATARADTDHAFGMALQALHNKLEQDISLIPVAQPPDITVNAVLGSQAQSESIDAVSAYYNAIDILPLV